ncbi:MAG: hypothetical protein EOP73_25250, partial [Variovorax sp.]
KLRGAYWLIDPMFGERASPVSFAGPARWASAGIAPARRRTPARRVHRTSGRSASRRRAA